MAARPVSGGDLRQRKPCPLHGFRAGLHDGDLLLQLENGARGPVTDQIARTKPGTRATIRFQRGSERKQAVIIVADELAFYILGLFSASVPKQSRYTDRSLLIITNTGRSTEKLRNRQGTSRARETI